MKVLSHRNLPQIFYPFLNVTLSEKLKASRRKVKKLAKIFLVSIEIFLKVVTNCKPR